MRITLHYSKTNIDRQIIQEIGVCDETGGRIARFEHIEHLVPRGRGSYYDRHRHCKGDHTAVETDQILYDGPDGLAPVILDALFGSEMIGGAADWRGAKTTDQWSLWRAMCEKSRGFRYMCPKRPKTELDKETKRKNEARQLAVYRVDHV